MVKVENVSASAVTGVVTSGGRLHGRPHTYPIERLSMPTPTDSDLRKIRAFVELGVDMVAVSYVRSAHTYGALGQNRPRGPLVVAKIETRAAVENLKGIIEASAGIMVARGTLELSLILPTYHICKIIAECIAGGLPVITATQMLDSMMPRPHLQELKLRMSQCCF